MRILLTAHAGVSHVRLVAPIGQAAQRAGHQVRFASTESMRAEIEAYGLPFWPAGFAWGSDRECIKALAPGLFGNDQAGYERALVHTCALGRPALQMARDLLEPTTDWRPDLVVREGEELAGYLVAERLGVPHVAVAGGSTHLLTPAVLGEPLNRLRAGFGLAPDPDPLSCYRYLLASWLPARYLGDELAVPTRRQYRQCAPARRGEALPGWFGELPTGRPVVFASTGTMAPFLPQLSARVLDAVVAGLGELDCTALVSIGVGRDPADFGAVPPHVRLVTSWLPQPAVLARSAAFVTHGGFSSVREGLRAGVPMVVVPVYDDTYHTATRVAGIGAGLAISALTVTGDEIRESVRTVLTDLSLRRGADAVRRDIELSPTVDRMIVDLETIAGTGRPVPARSVPPRADLDE